MKKILHVIAGNLFGGVESFLVALANSNSQERNIEHWFAVCYEGRLSEELRFSGATVNLIGHAKILNYFKTVRANNRLEILIKNCNPDVVICHMSWTQILFGGTASKKGPWVAHHHGPAVRSWIDWIATRKKPDLVISPSRHSSGTWQALYNRPVQTLNYPVRQGFAENSENISKEQARIMFGLPEKMVLILQCSRLERWKGHDILLNALAKIRDNDQWKMVFAGSPQKKEDSDYFEELKMQCGKLGLNNWVIWLGDVKDVPVLMKACDIYCQANRGPEGFSLAFLEASFSGLPIITTNIGGASEIIEDNGSLIPRPDSDLFAKELLNLINDSDLRSLQSKAAVEVGNRKGNPIAQIKKYEEMCLDLCRT